MKTWKLLLWIETFLSLTVIAVYLLGGVKTANSNLPYKETALTLSAAMLTGEAVGVHCVHPPDTPWTDGYVGYADSGSKTVWLRYCTKTIRLEKEDVDTFAHELIHILHPDWSHPKVYRTAPYYEPKVARAIIRAKAILLTRESRTVNITKLVR